MDALAARRGVAELLIPQPSLQRRAPLHQHRGKDRVAPAWGPFGKQCGQALRGVGHRGHLRRFSGVRGDIVQVRLGGDAAHQLGALGTVKTPAVAAQRPAVLTVGAAADRISVLRGDGALLADPRRHYVPGEPQPGARAVIATAHPMDPDAKVTNSAITTGPAAERIRAGDQAVDEAAFMAVTLRAGSDI
ncbi:MAG: hypothetical protein ABI253_03885 [Mycobacterium sp.]